MTDLDTKEHWTRIENLMKSQVVATLAAACMATAQSPHTPEDAKRIYDECWRKLYPR